MKNFLVFIAGFIAGVISVFIILYFLSVSEGADQELRGLKIFEEKGDCIPGKKFQVFQVAKSNMALASSGNFPDEVTVLLINYDGKHYYDNQKVNIPSDKCARQIGTYEYMTIKEIPRNVPAVVIE